MSALERVAPRYSLELKFLFEGKAHVPHIPPVDVTIRDGRGSKVFDLVSPAPLVLARLRPGSYMVTADNDGKREALPVVIRAGQHRTLAFDWKA